MSTNLSKAVLAGVIQGISCTVAMSSYVYTGELGTLGWLCCLIFMVTFFFIGMYKQVDKKMGEKVGVLITTNLVISTYMVERNLLEDFKEFASQFGMDTTLAQVPEDEV